MTEVSLGAYYYAVEKARTLNPSWRVGQTYFNVLRTMRPDLAEKIHATKIDPFYVDKPEEKMIAFLEWVTEHWKDTP